MEQIAFNTPPDQVDKEIDLSTQRWPSAKKACTKDKDSRKDHHGMVHKYAELRKTFWGLNDQEQKALGTDWSKSRYHPDHSNNGTNNQKKIWRAEEIFQALTRARYAPSPSE